MLKTVDPTIPAEAPDTGAPQRTAQVLRFRGASRHELPVDRVLDMARAEGLACAIVIGYDGSGEEFFASTMADGADALWLLERLKLRLLTVDPNEV